MKVLFVVNAADFFVSHRLPLAIEARERGYEVVVASAADTGEEQLADLRIRHRPFPMTRSGFNPIQELGTFWSLRRLYLSERPDLVHHVTIKPVIYGTPAARMAGVPAVVNAVPGMGFVFTRRGLWASVRRAFVNMLYRFALSHERMRVIFQNTEDMRGFVGHAIIERRQATLIRGSGVDLKRFCYSPECPGPPVFLLVARMLRDKGVREFVRAADVVKKQHPDWRFQLLGDVDPGNPSTLTAQELTHWQSECGVEWLGHQSDVAAYMRAAHVVCLPSYREGLPKTLLEASASGRPMIATDVAGCREVVKEGVTGILVPSREVEPLVQAMLTLGTDARLRARLGKAASARARAVFSIEDVVEHTFRVYDELIS